MNGDYIIVGRRKESSEKRRGGFNDVIIWYFGLQVSELSPQMMSIIFPGSTQFHGSRKCVTGKIRFLKDLINIFLIIAYTHL